MLGDVAPPLGQGTEGVSRVGRLPVELGRDIVDGALLQPGQRVAEDAVVLPVAAGRAGGDAMLTGRCAAGACHASGADAEAHLGLHVLDHVIDIPDHHVDIVTSPVGKSHVHSRVIPQIIVPCAAVRGDAVGVEVVVKHDTVHVIVGDDFPNHVNDALARLGQARIQDGGRGAAAGVTEQHALVLQVLVLRRIPVGARAPAVGINPGVALDTADMALRDGILQRVIARILAAGAGQVTRPGLIARLVEGVTHRAHLQENRIEVLCLEVVQISVQFSLLGTGIIDGCRPVDAIDSGNPGGAHLALQGLGGIDTKSCCHSEGDEQHNNSFHISAFLRGWKLFFSAYQPQIYI